MAAALEGALHAGCPALNLASRPCHDPATPLDHPLETSRLAGVCCLQRVACIRPGGALHRPKTGQVTYTDGKCAAGTTGHEVEAKRSAEEIEQDRKAAERAIELKQQRLQAEKAAADLQAQRDAEQERVRAARAAATAPQPQDYARSAECARSRRNLELVSSTLSGNTYDQEPRLEAAQRQMDLDCLGPQGYAELERARATQPRIVVAPPRQPVYPPLFRKSRTSRTAATFTAWTTPAPATHGRGQGAFPATTACAAQRRSGPC